MVVWRWLTSIPPKTRAMVGVGIMAYACAGMYLSDKAEKKWALTPTEQDKEELRRAIPKISIIDKTNR